LKVAQIKDIWEKVFREGLPCSPEKENSLAEGNPPKRKWKGA
jgi:hypothetical protein